MKTTIQAFALLLAAFALQPAVTAIAPLQDTSPAALTAQDEKPKDRAAIKHYDLGKKNLALGGYDPVAYFDDFGGKATKGSKKITATHEGVLYRFASQANKKAFVADPTRFEPMYGGWCAWAMSDGKGDKTEANPKSFTIEGGRLYVFYDGFWGNTRKSWKKKGSAPKLKSKADKNWKRFSGEAVRDADKPKPAPAPAPEKGKSTAAS